MSSRGAGSSRDVLHTTSILPAVGSSSAADADTSGLSLRTYNLGITDDTWGSRRTVKWRHLEHDFHKLLRAQQPNVIVLQECGPYGRIVPKVTEYYYDHD